MRYCYKPGDFDFNLFKILRVVITSGNVTNASKYLNVTPSAVTLSLQKLERIYNEELFTRTQFGLKPTARAIEIDAAFHAAESLINKTLENKQMDCPPLLRILTHDYCEVHYISGLLSMHDKFRISVEMINKTNTIELSQRLYNSTNEIVLSHHPVTAKDIACHTVDTFQHYVALCSLENPLAEMGKLSLYAFHSAGRVTHNIPSRYTILSTDLNTEFMGKLKQRDVYYSESLHNIVHIIGKSLLISIVPYNIAVQLKQFCNNQIALLWLPDELSFERYSIYLSYHLGSHKLSIYEDLLHQFKNKPISTYA